MVYDTGGEIIHVNFYHNIIKNSIRIEWLVYAHIDSPFPLTDWEFRLLDQNLVAKSDIHLILNLLSHGEFRTAVELYTEQSYPLSFKAKQFKSNKTDNHIEFTI